MDVILAVKNLPFFKTLISNFEKSYSMSIILISRKLPKVINQSLQSLWLLFFTLGISFNTWVQVLVLKWGLTSFYKIFSNDSANSTTCHFAAACDKVIIYGHNLKIKLF